MEEWIMDVALGLMVFWAYMMAFLAFDQWDVVPSKATTCVTAAIIVVAIIL